MDPRPSSILRLTIYRQFVALIFFPLAEGGVGADCAEPAKSRREKLLPRRDAIGMNSREPIAIAKDEWRFGEEPQQRRGGRVPADEEVVGIVGLVLDRRAVLPLHEKQRVMQAWSAAPHVEGCQAERAGALETKEIGSHEGPLMQETFVGPSPKKRSGRYPDQRSSPATSMLPAAPEYSTSGTLRRVLSTAQCSDVLSVGFMVQLVA